MKKVYEKPQVYMERFELSQNVAVCDYKLASGDPNSCKIEKDNFPDDGADCKGGFLQVGPCDFKIYIVIQMVLLFRLCLYPDENYWVFFCRA